MSAAGDSIPEVESRNVAQFFGGKRAFKIPDYQREYAWEEEQVEALCTDLQGFFDSDEPYYMLGQTIIAQNADLNDKSRYQFAVVDGQQRLTTLFLFVLAARDQLKALELNAAQLQVVEVLTNMLRFIDDADGQAVTRLKSNESGNSYLAELLRGDELPIEGHSTETQRNIAENFTYIRSFLKDKFVTSEALTSFVQKLLYKVFIIETKLETQEHALDIFEKLNSRGRPLNSADLLKNLLFQQASIAEYEKISRKWYEAAKDAFAVRPHKAASMEYLMKSQLGEKLGVGTSNREVFKAWKKQLSGEIGMVAFSEELAKAAKYFRQVGTPAANKDNEFLLGSRFFKTVQHLPLAIAGRSIRKDQKAFELLSRLIDARIVLSLFGEEKSQTLDLEVWPWVKKIASLANPSVEQVYEISKDAFSSQNDLIQVGSVVFSNLNYEKSKDRKRILFALSLVTNSFDMETQLVDSITAAETYLSAHKKGGFHLDHIAPKSLFKEEILQAEGGSWVHQPGNIALLTSKDNIKIAAAEPKLKSGLYLSSKVILTQALGTAEDNKLEGVVRKAIDGAHAAGHPTVESWGPDTVSQRNVYLWEKFSNRFKIENIYSDYV